MDQHPRHSMWERPPYSRIPLNSPPPLVLPGIDAGNPVPPQSRLRGYKVGKVLLVCLFLLDALSGLATGGFAAEFHVERLIAPLLSSSFPRQTAPIPPSRPTPKSRSTPMVTPSPGNVEAADSFQRENSLYWGNASDGRWRWGADANSNTAFSIMGKAGVISGNGTFSATLGPSLRDSEATFTGSISVFTGRSNMGVILRWVSSNEWYKAYIDGSHLVIIKRRGTLTTTLGSVQFPSLPGKQYTVQFRSTGEQFLAKAWAQGTAEPSWQLRCFDSSPNWFSGSAGLRVLLDQATVRVNSFQERDA